MLHYSSALSAADMERDLDNIFPRAFSVPGPLATTPGLRYKIPVFSDPDPGKP